MCDFMKLREMAYDFFFFFNLNRRKTEFHVHQVSDQVSDQVLRQAPKALSKNGSDSKTWRKSKKYNIGKAKTLI